MTKKQLQEKLEWNETNLRVSLEHQATLKEENGALTDKVTHLEDKVRMLEELAKMDKTEILELEAQLALAKLRLHRSTERANELQRQLNGISFMFNKDSPKQKDL